MKQKGFVFLVFVLLAFFIDGVFSFVQNPKLEQQLLEEVSAFVDEQLGVAFKPDEAENEAQSKTQTESATAAAFVKRIVDADTIELSNGEKVRYIGINAPETKHPTKSIECYGKIASAMNEELVLEKEVLLEKDVSETDRYGRLLRYVYVVNPDSAEEIFVNEYLVREGFAKASSHPPDVKYQELFREAEAQARELQKGLWGEECQEQ